MFWKKKNETPSPAETPRRGMSMDSPRPQPILKTTPDQGGGPSIRFAGSTDNVGGTPRSNSSPLTSQTPTQASTRSLIQVQSQRTPQNASTATMTTPTAQELRIMTSSPTQLGAVSNPAIQRLQGPRRSSRPTSPSSTSFGARLPTSQSPVPLRQAPPLATPPMTSGMHVTTPPSVYVSDMHNRAPPPSSPYRPTSERRADPLRELHGVENLASRPPRISSLFETPCGVGRSGLGLIHQSAFEEMNGEEREDLPVFNIIPATPQAMGDEWAMRRSASGSALGRAFDMEGMVDIPLESSSSAPVIGAGLGMGVQMETITEGIPSLDSLPAIANLEFSPFDIAVPLPSTDSGSSISSLPYSVDSRDKESPASYTAPLPAVSQFPPDQPLPSPPFESYPSLPSLDSEPSLRHSNSQSSLPSSSSNSSLASYTDVEEALGSMLASLSDPKMPIVPSIPRLDKVIKSSSNPGLGLGLSLPPSASITAPLSPRRKGPPTPLDLTEASRAPHAGPDQYSAPARINHRVAFYTTARAAPNSSPTSGIFFNGNNGQTEFILPSPTRSESGSSIFSSDTQMANSKDVSGWRDSIRSSISIGSEASDDDPYTASIVCLTPVKGGVASLCREGFVNEMVTHEVGLAL